MKVQIVSAALFCALPLLAETSLPREKLLLDFNWRFSFGNAADPAKDFDPAPASQQFSYFAKAGNGVGAAAANFDDRGWRMLNLPHDWAVEVPFSERGSGSHGYKAIGKNFPEWSVGWYRKTFSIPASDLGKRVSVEFDGAFRDSEVWVNGFYLGRELSGYSPFGYDISDYLNYGGDNTIAVRLDASLEEGWFYEGAGIYRHVWLTKTAPLHVIKWGTFVTTELKENAADVTARVTVADDSTNSAAFAIEQAILDADGNSIAAGDIKNLLLEPGASSEFSTVLNVPNPKLWSCEAPYLYKLVSVIRQGDKVVDRYETPFGIRTLRWDANEGFFLNGQRLQLKGTCNHQDHAGVGTAIPDELNLFRIEQLKKMGCNAIRTSHNAPTPELLDACDRLGMLVMDENREYGINPEQLDELKRLILRDRNHPCVFVWSLGNEEWPIEGNEKGARVTQTMQTFAHRLDPTRLCTVAISGGWGTGSSMTIDVMGYNYFTHGDGRDTGNDRYHAKFPNQPSVATEDASTFSTRGIYYEDRDRQHLTAYDVNKPNWGITAEESWSHYVARPYVAGQFQWTGFDYRGEPTPFGWPAISSQFGILDMCGFPKDNFYYYQAWWSDHPVVHLLPHWNWSGKDGQDIDVWVHSNCEEVELFLNGQSQGRKAMPKNSHLEWKVKYTPGVLLARGYNDSKEIVSDKVETTGSPTAIQLTPHKANIQADGEDVSVITVQANDAQGRMVPDAGSEISFEISGPGKIIGVGNGNPSSHEPDKFIETVSSFSLADWHRKTVDSMTNLTEVAFDFDDSDWQIAFAGGRNFGGHQGGANAPPQITVYRGSFDLPQIANCGTTFALDLRAVGEEESVYLNGRLVAENVSRQKPMKELALAADQLRAGKNVVAIVATPPQRGRGERDGAGGNLGNLGLVRVVTPAGEWKRSLFSGLAQVIVQSTGEPGQITLTAKSPGVADGVLKIQAGPTARRPTL